MSDSLGAYEIPDGVKGTILEGILEIKLRENSMKESKLGESSLRMALEKAQGVRSLKNALLRKSPAVIAEIKRASPSAGIIRASFDPVTIARGYQTFGAAAISILTEVHHFRGGLECLAAARWNTQVPLLRKDFMVDRYQIFESRHAGADAVLLIAALLDRNRLRDLLKTAGDLEMEALVEIHNKEELERAVDCGASLIGINSRDLRTFEVSLEVCFDLIRYLPGDVVAVAESGIRTPEDIRRLMAAGYRGFLIGEQFMRAPSPGMALGEILSSFRRPRRDAS